MARKPSKPRDTAEEAGKTTLAQAIAAGAEARIPAAPEDTGESRTQEPAPMSESGADASGKVPGAGGAGATDNDPVPASGDLQPFGVLGNLNHDGRTYAEGDIVHLDPATAITLQECNLIMVDLPEIDF